MILEQQSVAPVPTSGGYAGPLESMTVTRAGPSSGGAKRRVPQRGAKRSEIAAEYGSSWALDAGQLLVCQKHALLIIATQ
jgi:hypothetical protein